MWKSGGEDLQGFYPVRPECQPDVPRTRFKSRVPFFFSITCFMSWWIDDTL